MYTTIELFWEKRFNILSSYQIMLFEKIYSNWIQISNIWVFKLHIWINNFRTASCLQFFIFDENIMYFIYSLNCNTCFSDLWYHFNICSDRTWFSIRHDCKMNDPPPIENKEEIKILINLKVPATIFCKHYIDNL